MAPTCSLRTENCVGGAGLGGLPCLASSLSLGVGKMCLCPGDRGRGMEREDCLERDGHLCMYSGRPLYAHCLFLTMTTWVLTTPCQKCPGSPCVDKLVSVCPSPNSCPPLHDWFLSLKTIFLQILTHFFKTSVKEPTTPGSPFGLPASIPCPHFAPSPSTPCLGLSDPHWLAIACSMWFLHESSERG
jgi:hypothetical protein